MHSIIEATSINLSKSKVLLNQLTDSQLTDASISPYYSCVGSHIRHILDFYDCILNGLDADKIDLTARARDVRVEQDCEYASLNVDRVLNAVEKLENAEKQVTVIDDLGAGKVALPYTVAALLSQANSHTIHHYAIISYILDRLDVEVTDTSFGYNPTTPVKEKA